MILQRALPLLLIASLVPFTLLIVTSGPHAGAEEIQMEKSVAPADPPKGGGESAQALRSTPVSQLRSFLTMPVPDYYAWNMLLNPMPISKESPGYGASGVESSLRTLSSQDRDKSVRSFRMTSPSAVGKLQADAEFAYRSFDPYVTSGFGKNEFDAYRLAIQGSEKEFSYGASYVHVKNAFSSLLLTNRKLDADRAGPKVWASWNPGRVGLSVFMRSLYDNLDMDRNRPRFTTTEAGATLSYMLSKWPYLGYAVSYSEGEKRSSREPGGYKPYKGPVSTVEHSLSYSSDNVDITAYSSYSKQRDLLQPADRRADLLSYYLAATFRPTKALSITPEISYGVDRYPDSASSTNRRSASLSLDYWPSGDTGYRAFGSYSTERNQQWGMDTRYLYTELGVIRALHMTRRGGETLSFSVGHQRYLDAASPGSNTKELTLWLILKIPLSSAGKSLARSDS